MIISFKINDNMNNVAENLLKKSIKNTNKQNTKIIPCSSNVVLEFYEENPYRAIETTENGLILGIDGNKRYKSNESGEMEDSEEYIACAKVIAVGDACRYVKEGDDVFAVKHISQPLPYNNKGYRVITETNVICKIVNDD